MLVQIGIVRYRGAGAGTSTSAYPLSADAPVVATGTCSPSVETAEFPALRGAHRQCVPRPTKDSHSPSGGSGPGPAAESAVGPVGGSVGRKISIPFGAR